MRLEEMHQLHQEGDEKACELVETRAANKRFLPPNIFELSCGMSPTHWFKRRRGDNDNNNKFKWITLFCCSCIIWSSELFII